MKLLSFLILALPLLVCAEQPNVSSIRVDLKGVSEYYETINKELSTLGFEVGPKLVTETQKGEVISQNFQRDELLVGLTWWNPRGLISATFVRSKNSSVLSKNESEFVREFCIILIRNGAPVSKITLSNLDGYNCESYE